MKRLIALLFSLVFILTPVLCSCGGDGEVKPSAVLSRASLNLVVGDEYTLTASVYPTSFKDAKLSWSTSNPDVLTCEGGKLRANTAGTALVKVEVAGGSYSAATVTVREKPDSFENIKCGESITLDVDDYAAYFGTGEGVSFYSSNPTVLTCEGSVISAVGTGVANISVCKGDDRVTVLTATAYEDILSLVSFEEPTLPVEVTYTRNGVSAALEIYHFESKIYEDERYGEDALGVDFLIKYRKTVDTAGEGADSRVMFEIELYSTEVGYCTTYRVTAEGLQVGEVGEFSPNDFAADIARGARSFYIVIKAI